MSIPVSTTTITVLRSTPDATRDSWDAPPTAATLTTGVRAVIAPASGTEIVVGGTQEDVRFRLVCDPTDLLHTDQVKDETTAVVYEVTWARPVAGLGLDHTEAALRVVSGEV